MKKTSFIFVIIAAVLWGSSALFVSWLTPWGVSAVAISALRAVVSFLFIGGFILLRDRRALRIRPKDLILLVFCGLSLFGSSTCYFVAIGLTSVPTAVVLMYTAPIFVMLFSVCFLGEKMNFIKGVSVACMLGGCVLVSGVIGNAAFHPVGLLLGVMSGVSFASYNILTKFVMKRNIGTLTANFYTFLFMSVFGLALCDPLEAFAVIAATAMPTVPLLILTGVLTGALPYLLYAAALKYIPAWIATSLSVIEPMMSVVFSFILLGEEMTLLNVGGVLLILIAVFLLAPRENIKKEKEKDHEKESYSHIG